MCERGHQGELRAGFLPEKYSHQGFESSVSHDASHDALYRVESLVSRGVTRVWSGKVENLVVKALPGISRIRFQGLPGTTSGDDDALQMC